MIEELEQEMLEKHKAYLEAKKRLEEAIKEKNPDWCGLSHHWTCTCDGVGGDR